MSQAIHIDGLDKAVQDLLNEYGDDINRDIAEVAAQMAKEATKAVKKATPKGARKGKYQKSIKSKQTVNTPLETQHVIHAKAPEYRLTHLLEYGHATPDGTKRTRRFPHWQKGQEYIERNFEKELRARIEKER